MGVLKFLEKKKAPPELPPLPVLKPTRIMRTPEQRFQREIEPLVAPPALPPIPKRPERPLLPKLAQRVPARAPEKALARVPVREQRKAPTKVPDVLPDFPAKPALETFKETGMQKEREILEHVQHDAEPHFVHVEEFKNCLHSVDSIKVDVKAATNALDRIVEIKNDADKKLGSYHEQIEELLRKFMFIDKILFEQKHY